MPRPTARGCTPAPWRITQRWLRAFPRARLLYGNGADVFARIRDPFAVHQALAAAGLASPAVRPTAVGLAGNGAWLRKAFRSSGGQGVEAWSPAAQCGAATDRGHYFQQRIAGTPCAAIYLAAQGSARLLGATEQMLVAWPGRDDEFRYAGSCGPLRLDERRTKLLDDIGRVLAREFGLAGLFGVDFIDDGENVWPVEVNPRYTASIEILERGLSFSAVGWHVTACRDGLFPMPQAVLNPLWHGKRILYAPADVAISASFTHHALGQNVGLNAPAVADIPPAGTRVKSRRPVMTVFAQAPLREEMLRELGRACGAWERRLLAKDG